MNADQYKTENRFEREAGADLKQSRKLTTLEGIGSVSAELISDLYGVSHQTFATWIKDGLFARQSPSKGYDLRIVCRAIYEHQRKIASGRGGDATDALTAQRVRLAKAKAEREERQNAIEAGQVARIAPMVRAVQAMLLGMRNRLLNLAGEYAFHLAMRPQEEIYEVLDQAVRDKLEELADPQSAAADAVAAGLTDLAAEIRRHAAMKKDSEGEDHDDDNDN